MKSDPSGKPRLLRAAGRLLYDVGVMRWYLHLADWLEVAVDCLFSVGTKYVFNEVVSVH